MTPQRVQAVDGQVPAGAVLIDQRPWANPWRVERIGDRWTTTLTLYPARSYHSSREDAGAFAVSRFKAHLFWDVSAFVIVGPEEVRRELAGRDVACSCPLDQPCHGDVLLAVANDWL